MRGTATQTKRKDSKMSRKLKALGLALMAVFAIGAVASSAASAEVTKSGLFTASVGAAEQAKIDAEQVGVNTFTINGLSLTCGTVTLTGNPVTTKASPEQDIVEGNKKGPESTDVTLAPTFGPNNCHVVIAGLTKTITVTTNGCAFVLDAKTTETKGVVSNTALSTLECPTGKKIEVHIYSTTATETTTTCTYDIEPAANTTVSGITLDNKVNTPGSANDILATIKEGSTWQNTVPSAVCGQNATETGVYAGEITIRATNEAGSFVDASVSS